MYMYTQRSKGKAKAIQDVDEVDGQMFKASSRSEAGHVRMEMGSGRRVRGTCSRRAGDIEKTWDAW